VSDSYQEEENRPMRLTSYLTLALLTAGLSTSAFATTYTFNAADGTISGNTDKFTNITPNLTLYGYNAGSAVSGDTVGVTTWNGATGETSDTFVDQSVSGNTDIGLTNGITVDSFVQFSASTLTATNINQIAINLASSVANTAVTWDIWGSTTATGKFTLLYTGDSITASQIVTLNSSDAYIEISGGDCDVLINSITAATPEPGTLALGLLAGLGLAIRRFAKKR
jgi:hypothetical protein